MPEEEIKTKSSSMIYIVSAILLVLVIGAGVYFMNKTSESKVAAEEVKEISTPRPSGPPSLKGQNFADTQLAQNAVQIYPGKISKEAEALMSGWNLKTKKLEDGTIQADLIPTESEAAEGDSRHTFNLKEGDKLYFVDLNPGDDAPGATDKNKNDDLGIVVNSEGVIQ